MAIELAAVDRAAFGHTAVAGKQVAVDSPVVEGNLAVVDSLAEAHRILVGVGTFVADHNLAEVDRKPVAIAHSYLELEKGSLQSCFRCF